MAGASNAMSNNFSIWEVTSLQYWVVTQVMLGYAIYDHVTDSLFRDPLFSL